MKKASVLVFSLLLSLSSFSFEMDWDSYKESLQNDQGHLQDSELKKIQVEKDIEKCACKDKVVMEVDKKAYKKNEISYKGQDETFCKVTYGKYIDDQTGKVVIYMEVGLTSSEGLSFDEKEASIAKCKASLHSVQKPENVKQVSSAQLDTVKNCN